MHPSRNALATAGAHAQALAAPVSQAAKAQRLEAAPAQQRRGQGPEHRPRLRPLGHELAQPAVGIAPAQENERADRGPAPRRMARARIWLARLPGTLG
jgi:hypothetical protein